MAVVAVLCAATAGLHAQPRRRPAAKAARTAPAPLITKVAPEMVCPAPLGLGVATKVAYCDVMTERDPAAGVLIPLPPHRGPVTLTFTLHNRHTYSDEQVRANRAYARYTATVGVLTMDNTLISRAIVQSEFRNANDLIDRIGGGAGLGGIKAVAPTGAEPVSIVIPEAEQQVSILGEKLVHERLDGTGTYSSPGRPVAVISNVMIEYRPVPARPVPRRRK